MARDNYAFNELWQNMSNVYDSGYLKIHGLPYKYCIYAAKHKDAYAIHSAIGNRVGLKHGALFAVYYSEIVQGDWSSLNSVSVNQANHLKEFIEQSRRDVVILK